MPTRGVEDRIPTRSVGTRLVNVIRGLLGGYAEFPWFALSGIATKDVQDDPHVRIPGSYAASLIDCGVGGDYQQGSKRTRGPSRFVPPDTHCKGKRDEHDSPHPGAGREHPEGFV